MHYQRNSKQTDAFSDPNEQITCHKSNINILLQHSSTNIIQGIQLIINTQHKRNQSLQQCNGSCGTANYSVFDKQHLT